MIKIKVSYEDQEQKQKLIKALSQDFVIEKESKEQKKGKYSKVYLNLK